ncbi:MAG: UDP-N-acetylglucosamine--N-acetylmuramyl-(pentapeptide) pyrophosphoryl-undecaprenol N-acetylglucosamine transferase [Endomicrobia bacterium]|nr:UDP-N-acetylglucosamine--N-acetylmuramyl-(pentapeptide) pyrophosphoryl-undecaprenol N-acetylglucosamine transferase [Endomicrobiia bacterium]
MNILIVTSHTGGHFYPAIEVCKKLLPKSKKIVFVTQKGKLFAKLISEHLQSNKVKLEFIKAPSMPRKNLISLFSFVYMFLLAFVTSIFILLKNKPKLVFSTGGYTAVPIIIASKILFPKIPIILHEQNCVLSLTNKLLRIFATKVCIGFDVLHSKKYVFTGNPLREVFLKESNKQEILSELGFDPKKFTLLVFGGSQGAQSINTAIINFLKINSTLADKIQIIHITGQLDFHRVFSQYNNLIFKNKVIPFTEEIYKYYTVANLIICRAGAMTITELIYFRKPAILIPLPTAAELHQHWNANYLKTFGCAEVVYQTTKNWEGKLYSLIITLITSPKLMRLMEENYTKIPLPKITIERVIENIYMLNTNNGRI